MKNQNQIQTQIRNIFAPRILARYNQLRAEGYTRRYALQQARKEYVAEMAKHATALSTPPAIQVSIDIPVKVIESLMCSAFEGGSNYWCSGDEHEAEITLFSNDYELHEWVAELEKGEEEE